MTATVHGVVLSFLRRSITFESPSKWQVFNYKLKGFVAGVLWTDRCTWDYLNFRGAVTQLPNS